MAEMVQIDKEQLELLKRADAFLGKAINDPDIGEALQKRAKADFPNARFAADVAAPFVSPLKKEIEEERAARTELQKRLDKREKDEAEALEMSALEKSIQAAVDRYRLTDDGKAKMIKRMKDMNNPDAESAAAWVTDNEPRAKPTAASSYTPQALNLFGAGEKSEDERIQLLHKDPLKFFDVTAAEILAGNTQAA